jgi:hypothetical protein
MEFVMLSSHVHFFVPPTLVFSALSSTVLCLVGEEPPFQGNNSLHLIS